MDSDRAVSPRTEPSSSGRADARAGVRAGLRLGAGLGAATFVLGVTFGSEAASQGWGSLAAVVCSALVMSGSAQFAVLTSLAGGTGVAPAVTAVALINARFVTMGVAVARDLKGSRWRRAFEGQAVIDASWVIAHEGEGRFDRGKLFGATLAQAPAWVAGTALGAALAPSPGLVGTFGLDVVYPAFFLLLLLDEVRPSRRARAAAGLGAALAAALVLAVPAGVALIGSTAGALLGLNGRRRTQRPGTGRNEP
ncbi:AzlC family ABC transporter permease [Streptomyces sp. NPDC087659]|uniref:AzlC family ABC transporter permease n=1 Tax=unclassified Streptomyces TaxID=2593676 RepID=UPI0036CFA04B